MAGGGGNGPVVPSVGRPMELGGTPRVYPKNIDSLGIFLGRATTGEKPDLYQYRSLFGTKTEPFTFPQMESIRRWETAVTNYQKSYKTHPNNPEGRDILNLITDINTPALRSPDPLSFDAYSSQLRGYISRYRVEMEKLNGASVPIEATPTLPILTVTSKTDVPYARGYKLVNLVTSKEVAAKMASVGMLLNDVQMAELRQNLPAIVLPEVIMNRLQAQLSSAAHPSDLQMTFIQRSALIATAMDGYKLEDGRVLSKADVMKAFGELDKRNIKMGIYVGAVPPEFYTPKPASILDQLSDVFPPPVQQGLPGKMQSRGHRIA